MALKSELTAFTNAKLTENCNLADLTTVKVGGNAKYFLDIYSLADYKRATEILLDYGVKYKVIGLGSNILFSDNGYDGAIIRYNHKRIYEENGCIVAFSGAKLNDLIFFAAERGYSGAENLFGIPATVGGAIANNAGAFGSDISDYLSEVYFIFNGKLDLLYKNDCSFKYRHSVFREINAFIYKAKFFFPKKDKREINYTVSEIIKKRKLKFPSGRTFGSVFKNPDKLSAGKLIEECGLSGYKIGGAKISDKHCNFIVNENATASDIKNLIDFIKEIVKSKFGIELIEEVEYVGDF